MPPQFGKSLLKDLIPLEESPVGELMQVSIDKRLYTFKQLTYYWRAVLTHLDENILGKPCVKQAKTFKKSKTELLKLHVNAVSVIGVRATLMLRALPIGHPDSFYLGRLIYRSSKFTQLIVEEVESQLALLV